MNVITKLGLCCLMICGAMAAPTTQAQAEARLKSEFSAFVSSPATLPNVGDSMPFAGGVIVRDARRQLIYTDTSNGLSQVNLANADPLEMLKYGSAKLKATWANQYGVDVSRVPGVQGNNALYLTAVVISQRPYAAYQLGGNGSVTAVLTTDGYGRPKDVSYDGKVATWDQFQYTNWFRSLTGSPGF